VAPAKNPSQVFLSVTVINATELAAAAAMFAVVWAKSILALPTVVRLGRPERIAVRIAELQKQQGR
jgi:hypothetical protein